VAGPQAVATALGHRVSQGDGQQAVQQRQARARDTLQLCAGETSGRGKKPIAGATFAARGNHAHADGARTRVKRCDELRVVLSVALHICLEDRRGVLTRSRSRHSYPN